jgi:hypothetical protein
MDSRFHGNDNQGHGWTSVSSRQMTKSSIGFARSHHNEAVDSGTFAMQSTSAAASAIRQNGWQLRATSFDASGQEK